MSSPWTALHPLRIGCVQYLNSRPLIHGYDGEVLFDHPSALARELSAGRLDAALVPVFEILRHPGYDIVDDIAIAADGPVHSVVLAHRGPLKAMRSVALDPASLTSVHLLKVLLAEFHDLEPEFRDDGEAILTIGNQAIEFREREEQSHAGWSWLDLGEEWRRQTGLPFVFAVWALRPGLSDVPAIADAFRALKDFGVARRSEIVGGETIADATFRERYLTGHIRFDLREREKAGLMRYRELLEKRGFISPVPAALCFV